MARTPDPSMARRATKKEDGLNQKKSDEGAHHIELTMGEIDQPNNSIHHGIAQGHEGVDAPLSDTIEEILAEIPKKIGSLIRHA